MLKVRVSVPHSYFLQYFAERLTERSRCMTNSVNSAKDLDSILFDISPKIKELAGLCEANTGIDKELFVKYDVKRGLRDLNGKGVLAGLTNISDVCAKKIVNGEEVPCAGNLYYRGYRCPPYFSGKAERIFSRA